MRSLCRGKSLGLAIICTFILFMNVSLFSSQHRVVSIHHFLYDDQAVGFLNEVALSDTRFLKNEAAGNIAGNEATAAGVAADNDEVTGFLKNEAAGMTLKATGDDKATGFVKNEAAGMVLKTAGDGQVIAGAALKTDEATGFLKNEAAGVVLKTAGVGAGDGQVAGAGGGQVIGAGDTGFIKNEAAGVVLKTAGDDQAIAGDTGFLKNGAAGVGIKTAISSGGYILAVNYYEQQTMGSRNMIQLQCYAKHLNLSVVKPIMSDSFLRTPLSENLQRDSIKLEDSFDLGEWQMHTKRAGYAPLVEWKEFLAKAPRDVILTQFNYASLSVINSRKKNGSVTQRAQDERYKSGCTQDWPTSSEMEFLNTNGFNIVQRVCFNFYHGDTLTRQEFDQHMTPSGLSNVTIVMDLWRGMGSSQRVLVQDKCIATYALHEYIQPSQQLVRNAEAYIEKYFNGFPFVAVMGRLEMALLTVHSKDFSVPFCFKAVLSELQDVKKKMRLDNTFLSIDIGKYGTNKWRHESNGEMANELQRFLDSVYGKESTVEEWEATFENISSFEDAGYIGLLQKVIVSRARCIVFAGGGAFQRHALHLYQQLNPIRRENCLRIVKPCTSPTKLTL